MSSEDPIHKLDSLTKRQREVLRLVCEGLNYKTVAEQLFISENTVKAHMGNVYVKLGLDTLSGAQRRSTLHQVFCQVLRGLPTPAVIPIEADYPEEPEPVPEQVWEMVKEDERAIIPMPPREIIDLSPRPNKRQPRRRRWLLFGMLLGSVLTVCAIFAVREAYGWIIAQLGLEEPTPISQASEEPIEQPSEVVIVSPTTSAPLHTTAPATQEVIVVTATPPPTTPTSTQPPLPSPTPTLQLTEPFVPPANGILFQDNFEGGLRPEWEVVSGRPAVSNGKLTSSVNRTWLVVGDPRWRNYIVEFDAEKVHEEAYVGVHVQDLNNMVAANIRGNTLDFWYVVSDDNWYGMGIEIRVSLVSKPAIVRITVRDNTYTAEIGGGKVGEIWDQTFSNGRVAINLTTYVIIDNFKIIWLP